MSAGSLTKAEQFVVVDDSTVRVDFAKKDRLTIPDLAVIVPCIVNSELVKKNASEKDPWGLEYTKQQTAGSGAYKLTKWTAGTEVIMERNDEWVGGRLPKIKRVIWRMVPQAGNRRALLERGDADISYELPFKDFQEMKANGKLNVVSLPFSNGIQYIGMNVTKPPFDNPKVRQAMAYAIPYQKIMDAVLFGLANPMFGAAADKADRGRVAATDEILHRHRQGQGAARGSRLRQRFRDHDFIRPEFRRRQRAALHPGSGEPRPDRHQDHDQQGARRQLAHRAEQEGDAALHQRVLGWLDYPEYFFYWCYHGNNSVFNTMSYKSPEMDKLIDGARIAASTGDTATYDKDVKGFVDLAFADIPRIPLYQPFVNVAMQKNISGYQYWFHPSPGLSRAGEGVTRHADHDRQAAAVCDPVADRGRDRHVSADARAAGRSGGVFRGPAATKEAVEQIRKKLGLDKPLIEQFFRYTSDLARADFGNSLTTRPAGRRRNPQTACRHRPS
jgi:peptide/nickel transport system substrate-binding protein